MSLYDTACMSNLKNSRPECFLHRHLLPPTSAARGLADYSQVDKLGLRYQSVSFGVKMSPPRYHLPTIEAVDST